LHMPASQYEHDLMAPGIVSDSNALVTFVTSQYHSVSHPVGKGRLKERSRLELQTNFFAFKKSPKADCRLDSCAA
jgi:hypothetical protein